MSTSTGGWSELLAREHRAAVSVFAGGILVFAINTFLTSASLPSTVADIGGEQFYAWVVTVFLIASVVASMLVTRALAQFGARGAYLIGFSAFAAGSLVCALTPTMPILLAGRLIQGLGGGLLTGLAFAVVQIALPQRIWGRAVALISAMWGVGNIVGPAIGGMFAEVGLWRGSFWFLTVVTLAIAAVAGRVLPRGRGSDERHPLPWASLAAVTVAAGAVSVAAVSGSTTAVVVLGAVALLALAGFVAVDRHGDTGLLPRLTYSVGNPLKWIYLSIAVLAAGSTAEAFLPLFGQQVGGLSPFAAGLLPAALSTGWTVAQIASSTWAHGRSASAARIAGPAFLAAGMAGYGLLQSSTAPIAIAGWYACLVFAGMGIGMAFPHIATAAMGITTDQAEAARASAGINSVQMVANTVGSAAAGLLVSFGADAVGSARLLTFGFACLAVIGVGIAVRSVRPAR
ncbi:MFS transporter [Gordonia rubripertincta]|uniref:MFS transporter n=2 Tax=Gordonia rubripertincta TaxID=36822 RepID=A0AAW6R4F6_GORRU|nr:MFS transporter [Gordonia rubripertincta]MDG6780563.1 MFS transporter [Gordonia rubripertincta]NKY65926.1 MFS transporter [Gordonia rubripertincta]GAB87642.1 putative drug resistance transporter [Gordonia rubripertincta NBRC 101908]